MLDPHSPRVQALVLGGLWVLLALLVIPTWGLTYWDFGDGNYLYVGRRINEGLVPYRDILAPQPPLHLLLAAWSQRIGGWLGSDFLGARVYCLVVRMLCSLMVYLCARRLFGCAFRGLVAAALYLALPIGFWWSLSLQSENVELVFLLLAFWAILSLEPRAMLVAGIASGLAMHCNMTAVPYFLCNALFLGVRRPRLALWYVPVALGTWGIGAGLAFAWAGGDYVSNVVLNQVGSFPRSELLGYSPWIYFKNKVVGEGAKVLELEGPLIVAALAAIALGWREHAARHARASDEFRRWEYASWYAIGMLLSIGFTMKGGTVNYIFVLGEPAVATFGADAVVRLLRSAQGAGPKVDDALRAAPVPLDARCLAVATGLVLGAGAGFAGKSFAVGIVGAVVLAGLCERFLAKVPTLLEWVARPAGRVASGVLLLALLGYWPAWRNVGFTLQEIQCELPAAGVRQLADLIERHSAPGDPILAPPFYAYVTHRTVAAELAENYLWQIKFLNEWVDGVEGEATLKMQELGRMLRERRVPIVLLDMAQTGRVPHVADAIEQHYRPLTAEPYVTRNTRLGLYVPAD
ncbi:MAG: glycosyltransferase family 39 protein [Candidatus Sumerlaeia bacterium]|nr:glycosyltransferase family 39 protein [Candidatus Sumerlaeia bacterium]